MEAIVRMADQELKWSQPRAPKMEFDLRAAGALIATLKFRSTCGTFATAESGDGCWTFKRVGFWQNRVTIRNCASDADLAVFKNNTWDSGGTLEFPDGRKARATTNLWMNELEFRTEDDEPLVRFDYGGAFRLSATVVISPIARGSDHLPLFVLLGWYLAVMLNQDASAQAAFVALV